MIDHDRADNGLWYFNYYYGAGFMQNIVHEPGQAIETVQSPPDQPKLTRAKQMALYDQLRAGRRAARKINEEFRGSP